MKTVWRARTAIPAVALVAMFGSVAVAQEQDKPASAAEVQAMRTELAEVMTEVKALRGDLGQLTNEVRALRTANARPQRQEPPPDTTIYDIKIGNAPIRGPAEAPVTIVEYVDFQCPFCVREAPTIKQVLEAYPDKVRWVFKHFPLQMHAKAKPVHAAAQLVYQQKGNDAFWKFHDLVIDNPKALEPSDLRGYAETLGVDLAAFDELLGDQAKMDAALQSDLTDAPQYKVRGTPTVFINGMRLAQRSFAGYKARIDEILAGGDKPKAAKPAAAE